MHSAPTRFRSTWSRAKRFISISRNWLTASSGIPHQQSTTRSQAVIGNLAHDAGLVAFYCKDLLAVRGERSLRMVSWPAHGRRQTIARRPSVVQLTPQPRPVSGRMISPTSSASSSGADTIPGHRSGHNSGSFVRKPPSGAVFEHLSPFWLFL